MAYLKIDKRKSGNYLRLVESKRDMNGKITKNTLHNLGSIANYSEKSLRRMGQVFYELGGGKIEEKSSPKIKEIARYNYGFVKVCDSLMKTYELDRFLKRLSSKHRKGFDLYQSILLMIAERLHNPESKLSNYNHQGEYIGLEKIDLHHLFRSLDSLYNNQDILQQLIYKQGRNLFNQRLDVVFYDVTTFYFESEQEDGFRMKGYSKDGKIGNTVIVFGMLIDKDKNPVGYRIYKGGQYEGHTFADAIRKLKQEYSIDRVITVADRGMMSLENIEWTEKRIEGHLCLCYISFTLLNYLQQKLKKNGTPMSENRIRQALEKLQVSLIEHDNEEYYLRSITGEEARTIFKLLRIKELPNLIPKNAITDYISIT